MVQISCSKPGPLSKALHETHFWAVLNERSVEYARKITSGWNRKDWKQRKRVQSTERKFNREKAGRETEEAMQVWKIKSWVLTCCFWGG